MNYGNNCSCGCNPCRCNISTTTSNCGTCCTPAPVAVCVPAGMPTSGSPVVGSPSHPTVTIENLLNLIETRCDEKTCKLLQFEITHLYEYVRAMKPGLDHPDHPDHKPSKPGEPGHPDHPDYVPPVLIPPVAWQLVENITATLQGDLTDKYPNAELLKTELMRLWKCMYDKQQHHGTWADNWTYRDVLSPDNNECLLDGGQDPAPDKIKVITPVDVGSTVFNTITNDKGETKTCLFESLVDNNITEPSMLSVLDGLWINYCDIKDVIDCVLPRVKITDCHQACDDPNHDGVAEGRPLCECVICTVIDTNTVDLTKTPLTPTPDNPLGQGNSIKADVIIDPKNCNGLVANAAGLFVEASPLKVEDTITVDLTLTKAGCDNKLKADVNVSSDPLNAISIHHDGLFAGPPKGWEKNYSFNARVNMVSGIHWGSIGTVIVPFDGVYHVSGNIRVWEQCAVDSAGYDTVTYLGINGGKRIPDYVTVGVSDGEDAASAIGTINNYRSIGPEIMLGAGYGKSLRLHKGDAIPFDYGYDAKGTIPAIVSFTVVGGISYTGPL